MTGFVLTFFAAFVFAIGATPVAERIAVRLGFVDQPAARKVHRRPVPLLGGLAIYIAFIVAVLVFADRLGLPQLVSIFVGATLVSFLGIWDDHKPLRPLIKLLGQVVATAVLIMSGVQVSLFPVAAANYALTALWVIGVTNAFNLMDNMDGLSGGVGAVASAFFFVLAVLSGQYLVATLAAALLGACLGFLRYNFNPASIFMGDGGALFLGFILAAIGIKLRFENIPLVTWMIPVMVLGLPIFDTTLVTLSRLRRRLNPLTTPGRDHLSHRLVAMGMTPREAVLTCYLIGGTFGMVAIVLTQASTREAYGLAAGICLLALWALIRLERVDYPGKAQKANGTT